MYLNVIRLANDPIIVPIAPILTPCNKDGQNSCLVNVDSRTAAGTLLMNCEVMIPVKNTEMLESNKPSILFLIKSI